MAPPPSLPLSAKAGREIGRNGPARSEPHLTCRTHRPDEKELESDTHLRSRSFSLKAALPRLKDKLRSFNPLERRPQGPVECPIPAGAYDFMSPTAAEQCSSPVDASLLRQKLLQIQLLQESPSKGDADDKERQEVVSTERGSASSAKGPFSRIRRWCGNRQRGLPEDGRRHARRASSPEWIFYCEPGSRFYHC
ncbi:hypothetical protein A9Z42_0004640 [Trichoderma parareesei]|uniref:Uncharacterized protein n=1 Tax=Trichoderma parareesei TaxID=858221 RepID=A0A2H2YV33_TRIPA|nr:hypothetical protein A9Z42_0004640 [Trichoderma parareesei]